MRQRKLKWAEEYIANSPLVIKKFPYSINDEIELEIGCGKGGFITQKALKNYQKHYIGIDIQFSCLAIATKKATELELKNINFAYRNAMQLPDSFIGKVKTIYLNFSDPWPKARHEKRRLTSPLFLDVYDKILDKNGQIIFRTDNKGLYEYSLTTLDSGKFKIIQNLENFPLEEGEIISEYEQKFRSLGNPIYKIVAERR